MLETDAKLVRALASLAARPALDHEKIIDDAARILRESPPVPSRSREIIAVRARVSDARTKLVSKKLPVIEELAFLNHARDDIASYLRHKYINYLGNIKNARGREAAVERAVEKFSRRISRAESVKAVLEEVIKDYDSRAFSIRDVIAALHMGEREA